MDTQVIEKLNSTLQEAKVRRLSAEGFSCDLGSVLRL